MSETPTAQTSVQQSSWHHRRLVGFDLETTSPNPHQARIVTAAIISVDPAEPDQVRENHWLVDPGVEIPEEAARIHGVTTERAAAEGMLADEAVAQIITALAHEMATGAVLVAMNAAYDFTVLQAEALRHGLAVLDPHPVVDPMVIDKQVDTYRRGKRTLSDLCALYEVTLDDAHSAGADARAAIDVALGLAHRYPDLDLPSEQIHAAQKQWKEAQSLSFQQYLRRTKPEAVIETEWPVLPAQ